MTPGDGEAGPRGDTDAGAAGSGGLGATERAGERAAKNTAVRAVGEILGKLASLVLFAALARSVGQAGLGVYVFAFAWVQIATMPTGLGLDRHFLRRVAKDRSRVDELVNVIALKLALAVPVVAVSFLLIFLVEDDPDTRAAVFLLTPGLLMDSLARSLFAMFNAFERGELLAASVVVQRFAAAGLGLAALAAGFGVVTVAGTYTAGAAIGLVVAIALFRHGIGVPRMWVARRVWRQLAVRSLPFATQDILGVLMSRIDAVILALLATQAAVGRYGAAYRLLEATFFLTSSINGAFAAMYTYLGRDTEPTVQAVFQRSIKMSLTFLVPCAVMLGVLAEPICTLIFGDDFASAAEPLRLLAPTVVLISLVYLSSSLIVSRRNPMTMVAVTGGMVALNVGLNAVLIPASADEGAALAMLITEAVGAAVALGVAAAVVGGLRWASMAVSPLAAGAAMAMPMVLLEDVLPAALAAGGVVYVTVFVALERIVSPVDLQFVGGMLRRRLPSRLAG